MTIDGRKQSVSSCAPTLRGEIKKARVGNYDACTCLYEFIDNALDIQAKTIRIELRCRTGSGIPHKILISDDGQRGIPFENMTGIFSWTYERKRSAADLGEYGTGFKTASVNLAEKITVLTRDTEKQRFCQAVADWPDMMIENRWNPQIMEITADYYQDFHPFQCGTTFILEGLRCEMFVSVQIGVFLEKLFDDIAYAYRYILRGESTLDIVLKGVWKDGEMMEKSVRRHELLHDPKLCDPFYDSGQEETCKKLVTTLCVYRDILHFYRVYYEHPLTKKWEHVEFIEKRKNGNNHVRAIEVANASDVFQHLHLMDTLVFESMCMTDPVLSTKRFETWITSSLDLFRNNRLVAKEFMLRAPRTDPFFGYVKHECRYHAYELNSLLGVQYNKQNSGTIRDHDLRYTLEHIQQLHEREFWKWEKTQKAARHIPRPSDSVITSTPHHHETQQPPTTIRRKNFSCTTKIQTLNRQECRDQIFDFVLKDGVLLLEYDHKNGLANENSPQNCQVLSVVTHSIKSRYPHIFHLFEKNEDARIEFIVDLLNCITKSKYFLQALSKNQVHIRSNQQHIQMIQDGLFFLSSHEPTT